MKGIAEPKRTHSSLSRPNVEECSLW